MLVYRNNMKSMKKKLNTLNSNADSVYQIYECAAPLHNFHNFKRILWVTEILSMTKYEIVYTMELWLQYGMEEAIIGGF